MSGDITNSCTYTEDGDERYRAMVERIKRNNARGPLNNTTSYGSRLGDSENNLTHQPGYSNSTLTSQPFYPRQMANPLNSETMCESRLGASENNLTHQPINSSGIMPTQQFYPRQTANPLNSETMYESKLGASENNLTHQPINNYSTVRSQQFYQGSTVNSQFLLPKLTSTCSVRTENSGPFQLPQTTRSFMAKNKYWYRMEEAVQNFFNMEDDSLMKLTMRMFENLVNLSSRGPPQKNPSDFAFWVTKSVQQKYYLQHISPMVSTAGSTMSVHSDNGCMIDNNNTLSSLLSRPPPPSSIASSNATFNNNQHSVVQRPTSAAATQTMQPVVNLTCMRDHMYSMTNENHQDRERMPPPPPAAIATTRLRPRVNNLSQATSRSPSLDRSISLFGNDSQIAQRRDQLVVEQARQKARGRPPRSHTLKADTPKGQTSAVDQMDISLRPGVKAVTRTGRPVKSPVKYWAGPNLSKLDSSVQQVEQNVTKRKTKIDLESSFTLRNNKVVDRKKTPPLRNVKAKASSTPLATISEHNEVTEEVKKPQAKRKQSNKENKENCETQKKKPTKKQNESKSSNGKRKTTADKPKKAQSDNEVKKQPVQKPAKKRKSSGTDETVQKKKKLEDTPAIENDLDISSGDELFGGKMYKKTTCTGHQPVSPTLGLLSAKKAAGAALSNETPPCKLMSQLMNSSSRVAPSANTSSAVFDAPALKPDKRLVQRVMKKVEKRSNKAALPKPAKKKVVKDDDRTLLKSLNDALKASYTATTPLTISKYNMTFGEEESDESDTDVDEFDDLE